MAMVVVLAGLAWSIITDADYREAFDRIIPGLWITLQATLFSFLIAIVLGLIAGVGRLSHNSVARNVATFYIEFVRGVPILVILLVVAFVLVPNILEPLPLENSAVSVLWRGILSLSFFYGAYIAEVFRAGIESVNKGQMEAARSQGMSHRQSMRFIILPQAVRNILPALGNDFISMLKDSSLLSVLAVRELTYQGRIYVGSTFRFDETYQVLTIVYLSMTLVLSLVLRWNERRLSSD
jgi:polar amino acid transport system permease protein